MRVDQKRILFKSLIEKSFLKSRPFRAHGPWSADSFCNGKTFCNEITRALSGIFALDDCLEIYSQMVLKEIFHLHMSHTCYIFQTLFFKK